MARETSELDQMQQEYKLAVDAWVATIRAEEELASQLHSLADVDAWQAAHFREEEYRNAAKAAKARYEDAIREEYFGF